jgi:hypothetical protein
MTPIANEPNEIFFMSNICQCRTINAFFMAQDATLFELKIRQVIFIAGQAYS